MEMVYFTVVAVILYFLSDEILHQIEIRRGKVFEQRSLIFFAIITTLTLISFALIRHFVPQ